MVADRERIAFVDFNSLLHTIHHDATQLVTVGSGFAAHVNFSWSPDGTWLIARAVKPSNYLLETDLYLVNVNTRLRLPLHFARALVQRSWRP